jgi:hypothetical protein
MTLKFKDKTNKSPTSSVEVSWNRTPALHVRGKHNPPSLYKQTLGLRGVTSLCYHRHEVILSPLFTLPAVIRFRFLHRPTNVKWRVPCVWLIKHYAMNTYGGLDSFTNSWLIPSLESITLRSITIHRKVGVAVTPQTCFGEVPARFESRPRYQLSGMRFSVGFIASPGISIGPHRDVRWDVYINW